MGHGPILLVRTPTHRYVWEPALQIVDVIPKGERRSTGTLHLTVAANTEPGALRAIARDLLRSTGSS